MTEPPEPYAVEVSRRARSYVRRQTPQLQTRIRAALTEIAADPDGADVKQLRGLGARLVARVGTRRIVLTIDREQRIVRVSDIGPRGDIYKDL